MSEPERAPAMRGGVKGGGGGGVLVAGVKWKGKKVQGLI